MVAAGVEVEQDPAVLAARILLGLRDRTLLRWPEWIPRPPGEASAAATTVAFEVPDGWPKRQRSWRPRMPSGWKLVKPRLERVAAAGSGACSSGEVRERSLAPPRARERPSSGYALVAPETPLCYGAPSGSSPSTSADRAARNQQRPRPRHAGEKAAAKAFAADAPPKEPMAASSPETPLDFGAGAAGSGASWSGDDAARPPPKRRAPGAHGSGGASSSGDEGCSSPAKRTRVAGAGGKAAVEEKAISEPRVQSQPSPNGRGEGVVVKFAFDLNEPWTGEGDLNVPSTGKGDLNMLSTGEGDLNMPSTGEGDC